ncbi:DUF397 domain-containing protein [Streptomyces sp. NPDC088124]|uniref:DUF397 domain-containing protein n=1 Tax=Streptomyces sp. NPDC088124 TaxID=3154654 RepID=UPI00341DF1E5
MSGFRFTKSSYSNPSGECVEIARNVSGTVAVRDSKRRTGPVLRITSMAWDAFQADVVREEP